MDRRLAHLSSRGWILAVVLVTSLVTLSTVATAQDDPSAGPPGVLTLLDCVRVALASSPTLGAAEQETEIASQDVKSAWGRFLPNLNLNGSYSKSDRTDFDSESPTYGPGEFPYLGSNPDTIWVPTQFQTGSVTEDVNVKSTYKDFGASAAIRLFDGLANVNNLQAAKAGAKYAELSREYTRERVVQNVAMAYYSLLRYTALRDVKIDDLDRAQKELERTETYFRLGSAAKADVLQQRVFVSNTELELVVAENNVKQARADLAYSMNQPLAEDFEIDRSPLETDMVVEDIETLYSEALENRLDLKAGEFGLEARSNEVQSTSGAFWPAIDVAASYSRYFNESPYRFGSQRSSSFAWRASASWDVFNRFQNWTNRSRAKANERIAEYNLDQAKLDAQLEVRRFHISMTEAVERLEVSRETIAQAEEEVRLAAERFRVGAGTNLDRIAAEVNLAQARADEVQAIADFLIGRVQLYRALGRFSTLVPEQP